MAPDLAELARSLVLIVKLGPRPEVWLDGRRLENDDGRCALSEQKRELAFMLALSPSQALTHREAEKRKAAHGLKASVPSKRDFYRVVYRNVADEGTQLRLKELVQSVGSGSQPAIKLLLEPDQVLAIDYEGYPHATDHVLGRLERTGSDQLVLLYRPVDRPCDGSKDTVPGVRVQVASASAKLANYTFRRFLVLNHPAATKCSISVTSPNDDQDEATGVFGEPTILPSKWVPLIRGTTFDLHNVKASDASEMAEALRDHLVDRGLPRELIKLELAED